MLARVINKFHVAAAEVGAQDTWQRAVLGIAYVTSDSRHADEVLSRVVSFIETNLPEGGLEDFEIELIHM